MMEMELNHSVTKLIENGQPVINLAISKWYPDNHHNKENRNCLFLSALENSEILYWLNQLQCDKKMYKLHGSFDGCFENACGKCIQFGLSVDHRPFEERLRPFRDWFLSLTAEKDTKVDFSYTFYRNLLAFHLFRAGYEDNSIIDTIQSRINQVYRFVIQNRYNIYISPVDYPIMPKSFQNRSLVDPSLFDHGMSIFPNIHDVVVFQSYYQKTASKNDRSMINRIIEYITDPRYEDQIEPGYGVMFVPPRSYYSIGWSAHFQKHNELFLYTLCCTFPGFLNSTLYCRFNSQFEQYRNNEGTYILPFALLQEKTGYLVSGSHMGMGVNRRKKSWRELESTYWMLCSIHHTKNK